MKTLPVVKCTVSTDEKEVDVSRWIDEYDMLETLLSRDKTSGVLATVTFPVNFVSYAKDYVKSLFEKDGLYAKARFNVYLREDYGVNYNLVKSTALDFGTYKEETERVTIECAEEELSQLINSEGKTKYEILVDEDVKSEKQWDYQRMELLNNVVYELPTEEVDLKSFVHDFVVLPLEMTTSELTPGEEVDFKSESFVTDGDGDLKKLDYFAKNCSSRDITFNINLRLNFFCTGNFHNVNGSEEKAKNAFSLCLYIYNSEKRIYSTVSTWQLKMSNFSLGQLFEWSADYSTTIASKKQITLRPGYQLGFILNLGKENTVYRGKFRINEFEVFKLYYTSKSKNAVKIDVVDPVKLMQKYLNGMSGKDNYFSVDIQWKEKDYKTMIVAAESIRQISGAKIYGSPNDFFDWMKVLGYEYECIDRKLIFKPRDEFFKKNISAMGLREHELADLIVQADKTYAYTSIEIGYDKQNYESVNGRSEANGKFCYTTGFIGTKDNKLNLMSPYRADSLGIELLCRETDKNITDVDKKSTDTKSDNDVFFVALNDNDASYSEYKGIEILDSGSELEIRLFNAPFNPYFLIQRNESLIGINAKEVKFKSTDMSRTAKLSDETDIYKDQQITKKLFEPIEYNFAAGHWQKIPVTDKRNGLIHFEWQGQVLKGFIKEIRKNYACETETTWILWAVK